MELRREFSAWKELCSAVGAHTGACHVFKSPMSVLLDIYICVCVCKICCWCYFDKYSYFVLSASLATWRISGRSPGEIVEDALFVCLFFWYQLCCIPLCYWRYFDMGLHVLIFHCELRWYTQCERIGGVAYQYRCLFWVCK